MTRAFKFLLRFRPPGRLCATFKRFFCQFRSDQAPPMSKLKVIKTIQEFQAYRRSLPKETTVGFVPTMGYLHEGHISLVTLAKRDNDIVVASIYVNPKQFAPHEDFSTYPRDLERDMKLLEDGGAHVLFAPEGPDMYPPGYRTYVSLNEIENTLEGRARPGFFRGTRCVLAAMSPLGANNRAGVATVVCKLFNIVLPDRAYFGQKDGIQCIVIKSIARDLNFDVEVIIGPTVREADGLAKSSRNVYLSPDERAVAPVLFRALSASQALYDAHNERSSKVLQDRAVSVLQTEPSVVLDYFSVADLDSGAEVEQIGPHGALFSTAVKLGKTRLIDNVILKPK